MSGRVNEVRQPSASPSYRDWRQFVYRRQSDSFVDCTLPGRVALAVPAISDQVSNVWWESRSCYVDGQSVFTTTGQADGLRLETGGVRGLSSQQVASWEPPSTPQGQAHCVGVVDVPAMLVVVLANYILYS